MAVGITLTLYVVCFLFEVVLGHSLRKGVERLYWKTQDKNKTARIMYDKVAKQSDFIEYEMEA